MSPPYRNNRSVVAGETRTGGNLLAGGNNAGTIRLWDAQTGKVLRTFTVYPHSVTSVAFGPYGQLLASDSDDGPIKL